MTVEPPIIDYEEVINEEYKKVWHKEMRQYERIDQHPVLMYSTRDQWGSFQKQSMRTGSSNAEKYGRHYDELTKEEQVKLVHAKTF